MKVKRHTRLALEFSETEYRMLCASLRHLTFESCLSKKERDTVTTMLATMEKLETESTIG